MEKTMIILFFGGMFASIIFLVIWTLCSPGLKTKRREERRTNSESSEKEEKPQKPPR